MLRIGPSGNSLSFYAGGGKHTYEAAAWVRALGLNAFEYSFGRGVSLSDAAAEKIRAAFSENGVEISAHAPYYTNFSNTSPEMIANSVRYITQSINTVQKMGGRRVVFHPASCGNCDRKEAVLLAMHNIAAMMATLGGEFILCPETMGKVNQIGTVEEIVEFCRLDPRLYPCYDFGHINSYSQGSLRGNDDYKRIIDYTFEKLGEEKTLNMHIHFSKIMYGVKGELKHLTFADEIYGPLYAPLAEVIDEYKMTPYIVCESNGTMAEDAVAMKNMHKVRNS